MSPENLPTEALSIELGVLKISAIGQAGIAALLIIVVLYLGTRILLQRRRMR